MDRDGLRELIRGGDSVVARWDERAHGEDIAARLRPSERRGGSGRAGLGGRSTGPRRARKRRRGPTSAVPASTANALTPKAAPMATSASAAMITRVTQT